MTMTTHHGTTARPVVEVVPLTPTTWRVCDSRRDGDTKRIVGYITTAQDGFEMLWMRPRPGVMYRYDTFDDAVDATATRLRLLRS
ncbi:hypothetical protein [Agromyces sp. C10]|uniref:hypothetical protein n=1 Tax=Agromyces sp. C10 TaxID=2935077 RepID=UPI00200B94B4|nr:hypothetical protein [Agromyces sp. C10]MCK8609952.1 hypothetical protein [Agromyces sp. C10]